MAIAEAFFMVIFSLKIKADRMIAITKCIPVSDTMSERGPSLSAFMRNRKPVKLTTPMMQPMIRDSLRLSNSRFFEIFFQVGTPAVCQ